MKAKLAVLYELFRPVVEAMGYQLWGVEHINRGRHSLLRVYLEKSGGIDIEDCAQVSRQISSILDVEDIISGEYTLEVSSPGFDRTLFNIDQFKAFAGSHVKVRLTENFANRRNFTGQIKAVGNEEIILMIGDEEFTLAIESIEKANIVSQV